MMVGLWKLELLEKDPIHQDVVMLAGVDQHLLDLFFSMLTASVRTLLIEGIDRPAHCCGFNELRPRPNNGHNLHFSPKGGPKVASPLFLSIRLVLLRCGLFCT